MNDPEFEDFRRRIQMQTASRRYRKRKKEEKRQQNLQIQGLQAELVRLQELETEYRQYQQRSVESLEEELAARTDEVNDLTAQVADAVKEELYWVLQTTS
ncbi:hypothetical protein PHYBOEH_010719 [Phytophthora boehmeriae]|uniref:BZIP domain-containing protein n=1 Tax=Phytophthora boehmeriae TaxID=109152 RepID=A0A8T1X4W6_9STRA|nr:hypothetical protein PHYBOEH_010719 [Phytophthora boehmeriae]